MQEISRQLLTRAEAARVLGVSVEGIRKLQRRGELDLVHVGRAARVRAADVEAIVADGTALTATCSARR